MWCSVRHACVVRKLRALNKHGYCRLGMVLLPSHCARHAAMPYLIVKENYVQWWVKVEGLPHQEVRQLAEKVGEQPELLTETDRLAEFSLPSWTVSDG